MAGESPSSLDAIDREIILALDRQPRATVAYLAEHLRLARGTVLAHIRKLYDGGLLQTESVKVRGTSVGRPLRALVTAEVDQTEFDGLIAAISKIPEVVECLGVSGGSDLHLEIVAVDAEDVYRITQELMSFPGIRRTSTSIVLRQLLARRMHQLL